MHRKSEILVALVFYLFLEIDEYGIDGGRVRDLSVNERGGQSKVNARTCEEGLTGVSIRSGGRPGGRNLWLCASVRGQGAYECVPNDITRTSITLSLLTTSLSYLISIGL